MFVGGSLMIGLTYLMEYADDCKAERTLLSGEYFK